MLFSIPQVIPKSLKLFKVILAIAGVRPSLNKIFSLGKEECQMKFYSLRGNEVRKAILNMAEKRPS